jgi:hypothetical protein
MNLHFNFLTSLLSTAIIYIILSSFNILQLLQPLLLQPSFVELSTGTSLTADNQTKDKTDTFFVDSPGISFSAQLSGIRPGTAIKAQCLYIRGDMAKHEKPLIHDETTIRDSDGYIGFALPAPPNGFIAGEYKIAIYVNDTEQAVKSFFIRKDTTVALPVINSFTSAPSQMIAGQHVMLNWKVTGASRVRIDPNIGDVDSEASINLNPSIDTTYTLRAFNRHGSSASTQIVKVIQPVKIKPDLIITEFWSSGNVISYRIKNIGEGVSCDCETSLYKNDLKEATDYVASLAPGKERTEAFLSYHFSPRFPSIAGGSKISDVDVDCINIRLCADGENTCSESNEINNCLDYNYGLLASLNFNSLAAAARWQCNEGTLKWPLFRNGSEGWASVNISTNTLFMNPSAVNNGWIEGIFGMPSDIPPNFRPFLVPHKAKFTSRVQLTNDVPPNATAKFIFGFIKDNDITYFEPLVIKAGGKAEDYVVDLGKLAGQQLKFVFRVESNDPLQPGSAAWIEPSIIQER